MREAVPEKVRLSFSEINVQAVSCGLASQIAVPNYRRRILSAGLRLGRHSKAPRNAPDRRSALRGASPVGSSVKTRPLPPVQDFRGPLLPSPHRKVFSSFIRVHPCPSVV